MKRFAPPVFLLAASFILSLSFMGCASLAKRIDEVKLVRDAINNLLPSDFAGDADIQRHDSYFDISLKAGNLHRNKTGEWTWDWVNLDENAHFPIAGFAWVGHTQVKLGKQP